MDVSCVCTHNLILCFKECPRLLGKASPRCQSYEDTSVVQLSNHRLDAFGFIPGDLSVGSDVLSRWYDVKRGKKATNVDLVMTISPTKEELRNSNAERHWGEKNLLWKCKQLGWLVQVPDLQYVIWICDV